MRHALVHLFAAVLTLAAVPAMALAQTEEPPVTADGRAYGYSSNVALEASGTTMLWFIWIVLALVCVAVMFKDPKRSHLD